ncbi:putative DNA (cytosine-5)-methyltransferase CMT1 isoform X1 [Pistacia vera]|uniref:putative DNA (cytosine-5)-methyltransferase CMT1 isoform X1 n=1 Tax=Pistacia vera TaxID=55513 RepID=UPI001263D9D3|nr:putative DNA (cytosine-5)-methyltransferase CMT1 isoform X1 [Pistacia vera]
MGRPAKRNIREKPVEENEDPVSSASPPSKKTKQQDSDRVVLLNREKKKTQKNKPDSELSLVGPPVPASEAQKKWPSRYSYTCKSSSKKKNGAPAETALNRGSNEEEEVLQAKCHYTKALIDGCEYNLGDNAYVKAEDGKLDYIARIIELFEGTDGEPYFTAQWFYRAEDTVIKDHANLIDKKRVFLSDVKDDNALNCIVSKVKIAQVASNMNLKAKEEKIPPCDLYYDMKYTLPYLTFSNIITEIDKSGSDTSTISSESSSNNSIGNSEMSLLDLYAGCGAMSTGLCIGASLSGVKLVTRWAVDINTDACKSLKYNHPETQVRNEAAEDFLSLLKEWEKLCQQFSLCCLDKEPEQSFNSFNIEEKEEEEDEEENDKASNVSDEEFEVERLLAICYGDPNKVKKPGVYFKVRWKGYGPSEDTWEPIEGLSTCEEKLKDFVIKGFKLKILPLPGNVDFICGGPPCQGVSGFNRFRNSKAALEDIKNRQLLVFMDIIEFLKPRYVLMENVVDILKFAGGFLIRYAIGRLVSMDYQTRLGIMAAGSYGLAQFRMRVFLWGAHPFKKLPQYPLPTHEVLSKGLVPAEFEEVTVAYAKDQPCQLEKAVRLDDAISDLPPVTNDESQDERNYGTAARTEFQKYIRVKRNYVVSLSTPQNAPRPGLLYDHRPLKLNEDDYERVCRIPKKKGANFRDLPGVLVGPDNKVVWDPSMERVMLKSGKPLVPDYAMTFIRGTSTKPFGRLWWDEIVTTVVTRAQPHNRSVLHPVQDRVLTIRENARLQGFPDCYRLFGSVKERYIQVGNAVAVPVGIALGYTFGQACQGLSDDQALTTLPFKFPKSLAQSSSTKVKDDSD